MFEIEYNFSESIELGSAKADEIDLRYKHFLGSVTLKKDSQLIIINWGWVPILDFALSLVHIYNAMLKKTNCKGEFEFTESNEKIFFVRNNEKVEISATFSEQSIHISIEELGSGIQKFCKAVAFDIIEKNSEIKDNPIFLGYHKEFEKL